LSRWCLLGAYVFISFDFAKINILKLFLTYLVPYSVTTYTALSLKLEFQLGSKVLEDVDLMCKKCHKKIHLNKGDIVPECEPCGLKTRWKLA